MPKNSKIQVRDVFLRGEEIALKALTEQDALESPWYSWFNSEAATEKLQQHYFPNTPQLQLEFYRANIAGSRNKIQLGIVEFIEGKIIGVTSLNQIDWVCRSADFSIFIGETEYWGKGYGFEATQLMLKHAFQTLNLRRVSLGVRADNEAAVKTYEKAGFRREGVLKDALFAKGKYFDLIIMAILRSA